MAYVKKFDTAKPVTPFRPLYVKKTRHSFEIYRILPKNVLRRVALCLTHIDVECWHLLPVNRLADV